MLFKILPVAALAFFEVNAFALPVGKPLPSRAEVDEAFAGHIHSYNYNAIVELAECSGSVVRFENSPDTEKAKVMTNGHCVQVGRGGDMMKPGTFLYHQPVAVSFGLLTDSGDDDVGTVKSTSLIYSTMTGTDIAIYELAQTYANLKSAYGTNALVLDSAHPVAGENIDIASGLWRDVYSCHIEKFVAKLVEGTYAWADSIRYSEDGCHTIPGTSGSPIISSATHKMIGINNTGNEHGEKCTLDNPCEVESNGSLTYKKGLSYGQETHQIYSCLDASNQIDLNVPGCALFH